MTSRPPRSLRPATDTRVALAMSILSHRHWHPDDARNVDDVRRALSGDGIDDILEDR